MAWRACSFVAVGIFASLLHAPTAAADLAAALPDWLASDATGPLHDAQCNMETVEEANAAEVSEGAARVSRRAAAEGLEASAMARATL